MRFRIKPGIDISTGTGGVGKGTFPLAFGFTAGLLLLTLVFFPVRYETNDDFALVCELSGYSPTPVSFVLNPITSHCLYYLYQFFPQIPWYGLWMYSCIYLGISLLTGTLIRVKKRLIMLLTAPFWLILFFRFVAFPGLTSACLLLLFAVFASYSEWGLLSKCPSSHPRAYRYLLVCGLFMGFLLRWELATYALVFIVPALLCFSVSEQPYFRSLLLAIACIVVSYPVFTTYLNSGSRLEYSEYSKLRKIFHDTEKGFYYDDITPAALKKVGWSFEDYVLFRDWWFLYDHQTFNKKKLTTFLNENKPLQKTPLFQHVIHRITDAVLKSDRYTFLFLLSALILFLYRTLYPSPFSTWEVLKRIVSISMILAGILFFAYYRFEPRIYVPLYTYFLSMMVILLFHGETVLAAQKKSLSIWIPAAIILLMAGAAGSAFSIGNILFDDLSASTMNKQYIQNQLQQTDLNTINKDTSLFMVINPLDNLMIETVHPLKERTDYTDFKILPFGWQINSPQYCNILYNFGVLDKNTFLKWTIDNRNAIWFQLFRDPSDSQRIRLMEGYLVRHIAGGKKVTLQPIFDFRNREGIGFVFFNLVSEKGSDLRDER